jgi:hypothetical protein
MADPRQMAMASALQGRSIGGMIKAHQASGVDASDLLSQYRAGNNVNIGNLNPEFRSRLANTLKAIPDDLRGGIRIVSGYRDNAQQAELRRRYEAGIGGQAAPPGRSQHNYGKAVDVNWSTMSPAQQAAWKQAARANGMMMQYSAPLHWGAIGDDGKPWRVGDTLNPWATPTAAEPPRPTALTPEQANALGMSQDDMIEYNKKAAAPPLPPPVNIASRPVAGYEDPVAGQTAANRGPMPVDMTGGSNGNGIGAMQFIEGEFARREGRPDPRMAVGPPVAQPDENQQLSPSFLASLASFLRGNA